MQLQQLRQAQIQAATAENQQRQQQLQSRAALIKTIKDANGDPSKVNLETLVGNGVIPEEADAFLKAQLSQAQGVGALDANRRAALAAIDERAADTGQSVRNIKDPVKRQDAYQRGKPLPLRHSSNFPVITRLRPLLLLVDVAAELGVDEQVTLRVFDQGSGHRKIASLEQ